MESTPEQAAEGKAVVTVLAAVLERLVKSNTQSTNPNGASPEITKFHALKAPGISIKQYLERIHKYASCSTECFVLALIYIDRLIQNNNFVLSELNVHRVVITAILLAAKFFDDAYYNNAYYAKVGGVLVSEMNGLEVEFLFRINFSLHVKPDVFVQYQDELVSHAVGSGIDQHQMQLQSSFQQHQYEQQVQVPFQTQHVNVVNGEMHQQQVWHPAGNFVPDFVPQQTLHTTQSVTCGSVTPSPPHNVDQQLQQHNLPLPTQNMHELNQPQPTQPIMMPTATMDKNEYQYQNTLDQLNKQRSDQCLQSKNYPIQNVSLSQTKDLLYATCCSYGDRLNNASSSPSLFNTVTGIYQ